MRNFNLPLFLIIDTNILDKLYFILKEEVDNFEKMKVFLLTSKNLHERFKKYLEKLVNKHKNIYISHVEDSYFEIAVEASKYIIFNNYDLVIGFGGGKVLDTAKYASYLSKRPYISIPSILSNDGVSSPIAVLKVDEKHTKSFGSKIPDGIIIDLEIIKNAPKEFIIAGIGDMLSNYTALYDWKLSKKYNKTQMNDFSYLLSEAAFNMIRYSREKDIRSINFLKELSQAIVLSGLAMEIAGNSRPCSGSEHLFSHALDEYYEIEIPHGFKVALGSLASCIFQGRDYNELLKFLKSYNINICPLKLGIKKDIFVDAWLKAKSTRPERFTILDIINVSESYLEEVYEKILEVTCYESSYTCCGDGDKTKTINQ